MTALAVVLAMLFAVCIVGFLYAVQSDLSPLPWFLGIVASFVGLAVYVSTLN